MQLRVCCWHSGSGRPGLQCYWHSLQPVLTCSVARTREGPPTRTLTNIIPRAHVAGWGDAAAIAAVAKRNDAHLQQGSNFEALTPLPTVSAAIDMQEGESIVR